MCKQLMTILMITAMSLNVVLIAGCESDAKTGSVLGALAGAGIGQLAGGDTEATLIGTAVGGAAGYMLGNEGDKKKAQAERGSIRREMDSVLVNVTNSNGSIVSVKLQRHGVGYVGARGEYYPKLPTGEQLRPIYGF